MRDQGYEADRVRFLKLRFDADGLDCDDATWTMRPEVYDGDRLAKAWKIDATAVVHERIYRNLWRATAEVRRNEVLLTDTDLERHDRSGEKEDDVLLPYVERDGGRLGLRYRTEQFCFDREQLLGIRLEAISATQHGPAAYYIELALRSHVEYTRGHLSPKYCELATWRLLEVLKPMAEFWSVSFRLDEMSSY